jgi:RHS repeat-associated protein
MPSVLQCAARRNPVNRNVLVGGDRRLSLFLFMTLGIGSFTGCIHSHLQVQPRNFTLPLGQSIAFTAGLYDRQGAPINAGSVEWEARNITDHRRARIAPNGTFTARLPSRYRITAKAGNRKAHATVKVPDGITLDSNAKPIQVTTVSALDGVGSGPPDLPQPPIAGPGFQDVNFRRAFLPENHLGHYVHAAAVPAAPTYLNLGSGNANFLVSAPVLRLPGRGQDLSLTLFYNSKLWLKLPNSLTQNDWSIIYDHDQGWPAPGWSFGFGKVIRMGSYGVALEDRDGTLHPFGGIVNTFPGAYSQFVQHTVDGTMISCEFQFFDNGLLNGQVAYPNGVVVEYGAPGAQGNTIYPTRITDANGNYITITYVNNNGPRIEQIIDTLGRAIDFHYDLSGFLTAVTAPDLGSGRERVLVRFVYTRLSFAYSFTSDLKTVAPLPFFVPGVQAIYFPADGTGYWFGDADSYSTYGMIAKVSSRRAMRVQMPTLTAQGGIIDAGTVTHEETYNFPLTVGQPLNDAPTYTTITETWAFMDTPPAVTSWTRQSAGNLWQIDIIRPDGTHVSDQVFNHPGQYDDGLLHTETIYDPTGKTLRTSVTNWERGDYDSPRITSYQISDELGQTTRMTYSYDPNAGTNRLLTLNQLDYIGTPMRSTVLQYMDPSRDSVYKERNIFNLPAAVLQCEGGATSQNQCAGNVAATTEYVYDYNFDPKTNSHAPSNTLGVTSHDDAFNPYASRYWVPPDDYLDCPTESSKNCKRVHDPGYWTSDYQYQTNYRGNITSITQFADAVNRAKAITQSFDYDMDGNLIGEAPACCESTTFGYGIDTQFAYPTVVVRGGTASNVNMKAVSTYDFSTGLPLSTTDANGLTSTFAYDTAMHVSKIVLPTGAARSYSYDNANLAVTSTVVDSSGTPVDVNVTRTNGLGLARQVEVNSAGGVVSAVAMQYDLLGRLQKSSEKFQLGTQPRWNQIFYDSLNRVTELLGSDDSRTVRFYNEPQRPAAASALSGQTTRMVDPVGRERWLRFDAFGRLAEVVEPAAAGDGTLAWEGGSANTATAYTYNSLGLLTQVLQGTQKRQFRYDSLGRMTAQLVPERSANLSDAGVYDPAQGQWTDIYAYDQRSNLTSRLDARGVLAIYDYGTDPLNRLQGIAYSNTAGDSSIVPAPIVHYRYMTTGDLTRMSGVSLQVGNDDGWGLETYTYDNMSRVASRTASYRISNYQPFLINYTYDSLNRIATETYPAQYGSNGNPRKTLQYLYQLGGLLSGLNVNGGVQLSNITYDPAWHMTSITSGAAGPQQVTDSFQYDPATSLLANQQIAAAGKPLLTQTYRFNPARSLAALTDSRGDSYDRTFQYDALGRLSSVNGGRPDSPLWTETYDFDIFGNRSKCNTHTQTGATCSDQDLDTLGIPRDGAELNFDPKTNHISVAGFNYDAAGNLTHSRRADGTWQQYRYDAAGRLARVLDDSGNIVESYIYGPDARRIARADERAGGAATHYVWDGEKVIAEYSQPQGGTFAWSKAAIYVGGQLFTDFAPNGDGELARFHHPTLSGAGFITNSADSTVIEQQTLPFGTAMPPQPSPPVNPVFDGYDRSSATGLDYAMNREYDAQARFLEPDPAGISASTLADPQTLNLYAFVRNDPINFRDPAGLSPSGGDLVLHCDSGCSASSSSDDFSSLLSSIGNALLSAGQAVLDFFSSITVTPDPSNVSPGPGTSGISAGDIITTSLGSPTVPLPSVSPFKGLGTALKPPSFGWGFGLSFTTEAGVGFMQSGMTGSIAYGVFYDYSGSGWMPSENLGVFANFGAMTGSIAGSGTSGYPSVPVPSDPSSPGPLRSVLGAVGSLTGFAWGALGAGHASDLNGPAQTSTLNAPITLQHSQADAATAPTYVSIGGGPSLVGSVSSYPTMTWAKGTEGLGSYLWSLIPQSNPYLQQQSPAFAH